MHFFKGRLFAYADTHRHRLGPNYLQIPVNCPFRARVANYQRDGPMCVTDNQGIKENLLNMILACTVSSVHRGYKMFAK